MTESEPHLPNLRELAMPARDLARGLKATLARSRRLAPMRDALPDPLRDLARGVLTEMEGFAASARHAAGRIRPAVRTNVAAGYGLAEIAGGRDPALRFAHAARSGLDGALRRMGRDDLMVSETVAAVAFRSVTPDRDAPLLDVAARLAVALAQHHAAGLLPGTPIGMGVEETRLLRLAAFAALLWMTVPRDSGPEDEDVLLALCVDVALSLESEIAAAGADPAPLAALLATYAEAV